MTHWHFILAIIVASVFVVSAATAHSTSNGQQVPVTQALDV